jgi:hypothetical protein
VVVILPFNVLAFSNTKLLDVNPEFKYLNQYYVQNTFSSPTTTFKEYYVGANKFTGTGGQLTNPLPLKNQDGTYASPENVGVFPEPGDNALMGRGSADLIVKEEEVLLRAGKTIGNILPNTIPAANNTRSFLQLSRFKNIKILDDIKTINVQDEKVVLVKYLIEWVITNPENTQDKFTGTVYLYKLRPNLKTNSVELKVDSDVEGYKFLVTFSEFQSLSKKDVITFINDFIKTCNSQGDIDGKKIWNESPFPIYYRPNNSTYEKLLSSSSPIVSTNLNDVFKEIKLNNTTLVPGYGLIYTKDKVGFPFDVKSYETPIFKYNNTPVTFAGIGADKLLLMSHQSSIPGKGKINMDGTLYGITNDKFTDEIIPKTSSAVRGEELLELIDLIVRFLVTHTHAYPGLPPVPVTQDGTSSARILAELQNAVNTILNENIRLN